MSWNSSVKPAKSIAWGFHGLMKANSMLPGMLSSSWNSMSLVADPTRELKEERHLSPVPEARQFLQAEFLILKERASELEKLPSRDVLRRSRSQ